MLLDAVGLAASLFRRGVPNIKVGTTLLAQVDAAIGLKCGVNFASHKNMVGAFAAPELVITDGAFLETLPRRQIRCGIAEMLKLGVASDAGLFEALAQDGHALLGEERDGLLSRNMIDRAIVGMITELRGDPFEDDLRRRVDFGHTISPALEAHSGYKLPHGEAVSVDVALSCVVSVMTGRMSAADLRRVIDLQDRHGLPRWHSALKVPGLIDEALSKAEAHRGMRLNLPLPTAIGRTTFVEDRVAVPGDLWQRAVAELEAL